MASEMARELGLARHGAQESIPRLVVEKALEARTQRRVVVHDEHGHGGRRAGRYEVALEHPQQHGRSLRRRQWVRILIPLAHGTHRRTRALRGDETAANGVAREIHSVAHAQLLEDVRAVAVDRLAADEQDRGDLVARMAFRDELDHLELAWSERIERGGVALAGPLEMLADQRGHRSGVEEGLAAYGRPAGVDEISISGRLEHVARRAGTQCLEQELLVHVHREHEDP